MRTFALVGLLLLAGCGVEADGGRGTGSMYALGNVVQLDRDPGQATYRAVDRMIDTAPGRISDGDTIVVGTVSDIGDVDRSSALGNLIADHVRTRLVQRGLQVSELRLRSAIRMDRSQGEMAIARDPRVVHAPGSASAVVTGTYAMGETMVHVSLKLVATGSARILGAADVNLPRSPDVDALLGLRRAALPQFILPEERPRSIF